VATWHSPNETSAYKPLRCRGPYERATGPFGNDGHRRCPNDAHYRGLAYSAAGHRVASLALCDAHTPSGRYGIVTPEGYRWEFVPLAARI
jgi:hypothetical protein